jgi:putative ABC transport system permease protein
MKMAAGANFTGSKTDSAHFILNETAVKQTGIKDPIGKSFTLHQTKGTIIGVVKDFNYASLKQAIEPSIFYYQPAGWLMSVRTTGKEAPRAIATAQKVWKEYDGDFPFDYRFLDQDYDALYKTEQRTAILFPFFAGVAIIICCLGLFGLATYMAQAKTKEISIRKILGATVFQITHLLAREFVTLVLIAFLIAAPAAWWFSDKWLQDFAYRIRISWTVFALTALIACAITLITISFQAIKAAVANPAQRLRAE